MFLEPKFQFENRSFISGIRASFLELKLRFQVIIPIQIRSFVSSIEALFQESKLRFFNQDLFFRIAASFSTWENSLYWKLCFQRFLRLKFEASFLESKLRLSKRIFNSGNQSLILETKFRFQKRIFNSRNKTSNLNCNKKL